MHELGVVIQVVKNVEAFALENKVQNIETLVLQIGELSSMIPKYVEACYPAAVHGTILENTQLKIEILPGNAMCKECQNVFNIIKNDGKCPQCQKDTWDMLCGKEFLIKEIVAC